LGHKRRINDVSHGGGNLPASARYRRQPLNRFVSGKTGAATFNARGDGVEQAHVAGWPSRGIPGPAKVESSPAAMATDSRPAEKIPWIWSKIFI
jgi:hypothetical protein